MPGLRRGGPPCRVPQYLDVAALPALPAHVGRLERAYRPLNGVGEIVQGVGMRGSVVRLAKVAIRGGPNECFPELDYSHRGVLAWRSGGGQTLVVVLCE